MPFAHLKFAYLKWVQLMARALQALDALKAIQTRGSQKPNKAISGDRQEEIDNPRKRHPSTHMSAKPHPEAEGGARPSLAARAGWSVVEACREGPRRRICMGRRALGTLPGPIQTAEGSELYSLLFWLRHLDPTSVLIPKFATDNQRIADGFNGLWDVAAPWTPHHDLWAAVRVARDDARQDVQVFWRRGHITRAAAGSLSEQDRLISYGTRAGQTGRRLAPGQSEREDSAQD